MKAVSATISLPMLAEIAGLLSEPADPDTEASRQLPPIDASPAFDEPRSHDTEADIGVVTTRKRWAYDV